MKSTSVVSYDMIRPTLGTGDIILFSGRGIIPTVIKWGTRSKWSHVAMVLKLAEFDAIMCWESTTLSKVKDAVDGVAKKGVQIVPLSERIATYDGGIAIRRLKVERTMTMLNRLKEFRHEVRNRPFEKDTIELVKSAYDGPFGHNVEDLSSIFCSELIAESHQRMSMLGEDKSSNEYTPKDFAGEEIFYAEELIYVVKGTA